MEGEGDGGEGGKGGRSKLYISKQPQKTMKETDPVASDHGRTGRHIALLRKTHGEKTSLHEHALAASNAYRN